MIDVPGGLLDGLKEMHRKSEAVVRQAVQVADGRTNLRLK